MIEDYQDSEFTKTFFNSITRVIFATVGCDPELEFITLDEHPLADISQSINGRLFHNINNNLTLLLATLLGDFEFAIPYANIDNDAIFIGKKIGYYQQTKQTGDVVQIEVIETVFYQITRAYLLGRIYFENASAPIVIALKNTGLAITVDAVMMNKGEISILFS